MRRINGVWELQLEGHMLGYFFSIAKLAKKLEEHADTTKSSNRSLTLLQNYFS
jgi:hypothetical protein